MTIVQGNLKKRSRKNNKHEQNPICVVDNLSDSVHIYCFHQRNFQICPENQKDHLCSKKIETEPFFTDVLDIELNSKYLGIFPQ